MAWPIKEREPLGDLLSAECMDAARNLLRDYRVELISCVRWRMDRGFAIRQRSRQDSFLFVPLKGKAKATSGSSSKVIGPGDIMMVPDNVAHGYEWLPNAKNNMAISVHCHILNRFRLPFLADCHSAFARLPNPEYWHRSLKQLAYILQTDHDLGQYFGETLLTSLLAEILLGGLPMEKNRGKIDSRIALALQAIHSRYVEALTVTELADMCEVSEVHFRNLFRKALGVGPKAYIARIRLMEAAKLLRTTTMTARQITYMTGFQSEQYFHFRFRKVYGCTPLSYRRDPGDIFPVPEDRG